MVLILLVSNAVLKQLLFLSVDLKLTKCPGYIVSGSARNCVMNFSFGLYKCSSVLQKPFKVCTLAPLRRNCKFMGNQN